MQYVDYEFYTKEYYGDVINESDFAKYSDRASDKLDYLTSYRLKVVDGKIVYSNNHEVDDITSTKVKKAVCKLAEVLNDVDLYEKQSRQSLVYEETENGLKGKVISSVHSGSESISYAVNNSSTTLVGTAMTDKKAREQLFLDTVREYLSDTGLLYAGI